MHFNQGDRVIIIATRDDCEKFHIYFFPDCFYMFDNVTYNASTCTVTFTGFYKHDNCVANFVGEPDYRNLPDGRRKRKWFLPGHCFHPYAVTPQQKAFFNFRQAVIAKSRHAAA